MHYKFLGKSGLKVSEIALGIQTFGWCADEKTAHAILDRFIEAGGNFLDMADSYNEGRAEQIMGTWLQSGKNRDALVIATKLFSQPAKSNDTGLTRKHIHTEIDNSLRRLRY